MKLTFSRFTPFSRFPVFSFSRFLVFTVAAILLVPQAAAFDVVDIPDPNLKKAIREALALPDEIPITRQEMLRLSRFLRVESQDLKDLTGLEYATNLEELLIDTGMISDLTPIANLIALRKLTIARNQISDISPLAGLIQVRKLTLWQNKIQDIAPLANLTNLTYLHLAENNVDDITPLANLTALTYLKLSYNQIIDLNPLAGLTGLTFLDLKNNRITDLNPLAGLTGLIDLNLRNNRISDVKPLANLTVLEILRLENNSITDITPLAELKNLKKLRLANNPIHDFRTLLQLEEVDLDIDLTQLDKLNVAVEVPDPHLKRAIRARLSLPNGVPLTQFQMLRLTWLRVESQDLKDLTGLEYATNLEELLLRSSMVSDWIPLSNLTSLTELEVVGNQISDIRPLANLIYLRELSLRNNQLRDITPLAHLTALEILRLNNNQITDITPLVNLTALKTLRLDGNDIIDITPLANLTALKTLWLYSNKITDIAPLAHLTALEVLRLDRNEITDITPLVGLKNLKKLTLAENPIHDFRTLLQLEEVDLDIDLTQLDKLNVAVEVPDPHLKRAIRARLSLPNGVPLTQFQMLRLTWLRVESQDLKDLTGLEYATNLEELLINTGMVSDLTPIANLIALKTLSVSRNPISDIRPLANLSQLRVLTLWSNEIRDITPLANLTNLTYLNLDENSVEDITPLANLTELTKLKLSHNQVTDLNPLTNLTALISLGLKTNRITDLNPLTRLTGLIDLNLKNNRISNFSPLANLINLEVLLINNNFGTDITPLLGLNLIGFNYDEICHIAPYTPSTTQRIKNRSLPSVFRAWNRLQGLKHKTADERTALHDLYFSSYYGLEWLRSEAEPISGLSTQVGGNLEHAQETHRRQKQLNPNLVNLVSIPWYATGSLNLYPPDSEFWLRDENGEIVGYELGRWVEYQTDFFHPGFQDLLVERIVALANCGILDGIMFDGFNRNATGFVGRNFRSQSREEIIAAMTSILNRIRARVHDDFLILANANRSKLTAYTEYINGTFMETGYDYDQQYTHGGLAGIENTLLWSEENLREPRINCLEGEGIGSEPPDSPANKQRMRLFTTLSLTHSDGYVLYTIGRGEYSGLDHAHIWHNFWDTDLGQPIGPKAQRYKDTPGLFIREFTNGWAVYNRSGSAQTISLPESVTGVSSKKSGITHILPDLDGEMYLKVPNPADVNGDGKINILDMLQVANNFGTTKGDVNGDGTTNILDLTLIAQQFSQ